MNTLFPPIIEGNFSIILQQVTIGIDEEAFQESLTLFPEDLQLLLTVGGSPLTWSSFRTDFPLSSIFSLEILYFCFYVD